MLSANVLWLPFASKLKRMSELEAQAMELAIEKAADGDCAFVAVRNSDELAEALGIDPIELRITNEPAVDPESGKPWSSRHLVECLREGAERFGWEDRGPGLRREGDWFVGYGVASSVYPTMRQAMSTADVRFEGGRYVVEIGAADLGTGAWTVLPQIAADALDVPVEDVEVRIGDTRYPVASVAGGSSGTNTWGSAIVQAAREFRGKYGADPHDGDEASGDVDQARICLDVLKNNW